MTRIIVTGSRHFTDQPTLDIVLGTVMDDLINFDHVKDVRDVDVTFVHGACPTGADAMVSKFVARCNEFYAGTYKEERHPADWSRGKMAGPIRNQQMVLLGADAIVGFPLGVSRGTRNCLRLAQQAGIPTYVYDSDTKGLTRL